jgi:hypothetical protein
MRGIFEPMPDASALAAHTRARAVDGNRHIVLLRAADDALLLPGDMLTWAPSRLA